MRPNATDVAATGGEGVRPVQHRIFIGIGVARDVTSGLAELARELQRSPVRLVPVPDIHLTLVPPWNVACPSETIEAVRRAAAGFGAFPLAFRRLCYGPQARRPRLLWAECAESTEMTALRAALLDASGQSDDRPFRPHVTLARLRGDGAATARRHPIDRALSFTQLVGSVEVFRSPPPGASGYRILASLPLAGEDAGRPDDG